MIRLGLWLLVAAGSGKQNGPLRIPLPFEEAIRAALEVKPRRKDKARKRGKKPSRVKSPKT